MAEPEPAPERLHRSPAFFDHAAEAARNDAGFRRELWGWSFLGIGVLALAGVMALLIAVSRIPGIERLMTWPIGFFQKGLVVHVIFSFVVWFFAVFGALLSCGFVQSSHGERRVPLGTPANIWIAAVACLLLAASVFFRGNVASLNNYVPVIIDPVFYGGLLILGLVLCFKALRFLASLRSNDGTRSSLTFTLGVAAIVFLIAFVCLIIAGALLGRGALDEAYNENLFWGFGHVLQFVNVALLIGAWIFLAERNGLIVPSSAVKIAAFILLAAGLAAPAFYGLWEPFSADHNFAFTNLQYALAPPTIIVAAAVCRAAMRHGAPYPWREPSFLCLVLSILVFGIGGVLGLFVDGADTRTPAHYHGVIAGINLAFMGLYYVLFLPALGRPVKASRIIYLQIVLFAAGQTIAALGLFLAGGYGAPRKVAGAEQGLEALGGIIGLAVNGIGAFAAVVGGVLFIWTAARALLRRES